MPCLLLGTACSVAVGTSGPFRAASCSAPCACRSVCFAQIERRSSKWHQAQVLSVCICVSCMQTQAGVARASCRGCNRCACCAHCDMGAACVAFWPHRGASLPRPLEASARMHAAESHHSHPGATSPDTTSNLENPRLCAHVLLLQCWATPYLCLHVFVSRKHAEASSMGSMHMLLGGCRFGGCGGS